MQLVFFDLDRTLLSVNSGTLWVRRELALGHISKRQAMRAMWWLARYQLGFASGEAMVAEAVTQITGVPSTALQARTNVFYETEVRSTFRPGALERVESHRRAGDRLVMLTSSSHYLADLAATELGFDAVLSNRLGIAGDGRHTGLIDGRVCFGEGKLVHARAEAHRSGGSVEQATFYTDSFADLPVMEAVRTPVAVNPDPRLRRHSVRRGWAVVDWGEPVGRVG
jgi:HAD superfamily hydrolase (TIGR01490 family)